MPKTSCKTPTCGPSGTTEAFKGAKARPGCWRLFEIDAMTPCGKRVPANKRCPLMKSFITYARPLWTRRLRYFSRNVPDYCGGRLRNYQPSFARYWFCVNSNNYRTAKSQVSPKSPWELSCHDLTEAANDFKRYCSLPRME